MKNLLFISVIVLLTSCSPKQQQQIKSTAVKVAKAELKESNSKRDYPFISKPYKMTDLSFRVGGPVILFEVQSGDFFKKGDIIASVDDRDYKIRKDKAEAVYNNAASEYKRVEALYNKKNISGSSYEKAKSDMAIAKAAYETASNELSDTRLIAPFDGYVQSVYIERFQDVKPSQTIVSYIDISKLKIEAFVSESVAIMADSIAGVKLYFDGMPEREFDADVLNVSKGATDNNLSFLLTAVYNNNRNMPAGMSGTLSLKLKNNEDHLVIIPQVALCNRPLTGSYVWVIGDDKKVEMRNVKVGELSGDGTIEIKSGLKAGEIVAVTSMGLLSDGDIVKTAQ